MAERAVLWGPMAENRLIGHELDRIDGVEKASGFAKYTADMNTPGTLIAKVLTCPHAHAKIKSLDVEAAKKVPGVKAVYVFPNRAAGYECQWDGHPIVAVAAESPAQADDGLSAVKVEYEVLPHFVDEEDIHAADEKKLSKANRAQERGKVDDAIERAAHVHKGYYGIHTITHMCLEPHGSHSAWDKDKLYVNLSTQNVSGTAGQFAGNPAIGIDAANVTIHCDYIGGGFGSKFQVDEWDIAAAVMAKEVGRPVKLMLNRATELKIAGVRPSAFAEVTVAADKEGKIVAWDSHHWGTNGIRGGTVSEIPYVYRPENSRSRSTGLVTNNGPDRAWRAPNHPQACAITDTAIDDLAAKMGMDSYEVFLKNLDLINFPPQHKERMKGVYTAEMEIGAKLIDWKKNWHPHGKGGNGPVKRGLGMALHTWGGRAHQAKCVLKIHPDGAVQTFAGSQDLGSGTRTVMAAVVAETLGLPITGVQVNIGLSTYIQSGPSGGSTTVGGVSGPHRRAAITALSKICELVGAKYSVAADSLNARDGNIVSGEKVVCSWKDACKLLGPMPVEFMGEGPADDGLTADTVGGVQMADVSVDTETGIIRINKFVAVQDTGTIISMKTAKSQVLGALIMSIAAALSEERIVDNATGRFINADLKNYKLPRIGDIGELVVEMYQPQSEYARGVVGLGEPPAISGCAAISNAVANAIGVRVPVLPMTPKRVIEALKGQKHA